MNRIISIMLYAVLLVYSVTQTQSLSAAVFTADYRIDPGIYCSSSIGMIYEPAETISDCPYTAAVSYPDSHMQLMEIYHHGEISYSREIIWRGNSKPETVRTIYPEKTVEEQYDEQGRMIQELKSDAQGSSEIRYTYAAGLLVQTEEYIDDVSVCVFSVTRNNEKALRMLQADCSGADEGMKFLMLAPETAAAGTPGSFYVWKEEGRTEIQEKWENGTRMQTVVHSYEGDTGEKTEIITRSGTRSIQQFQNGNLISEEVTSPGYHEVTEYTYADNGKPAEIRKRTDGSSRRVVFSYSSTDELIEKKVYEDGVIAKTETYADGTLMKTDIYSNGRLIISREYENK